MNFVEYIERHRAWSLKTFGEGDRTLGTIKHIEKELVEIKAAPGDLEEWIDVVILAIDGAWRLGASPELIASALQAKQAKNVAREWPPLEQQVAGEAVEHLRSIARFVANVTAETCEAARALDGRRVDPATSMPPLKGCTAGGHCHCRLERQTHEVRQQGVDFEAQRATFLHQLQFRDDDGSPLHVHCRGCGSAKGDPCRASTLPADSKFCHARCKDNVKRYTELKTYGVVWESPCCKRRLWLVWRQLGDELEWREVPCMKCRKTYGVQRRASDVAPGDRVEVERINGQLVEMTCWAQGRAEPPA